MPSTNRSILAWGESGSAKTSQASYLSKRIWRKHSKRTRLLNFGDGGWDACRAEIEAGLIEPWRVPFIQGHMTAIMRKLSLGYWPELQAGKLKLVPPTAATWEEFGLLVVDGLTGLTDLIFRDFQQSGMRVGNDPAPVLLTEGSDDLGGKESLYAPTQGHYNFSQKEARMLVLNVTGLPYEMTYWTALESKGEEQVGKDTVYGPMLVGSAQTPKAPSWFGDCLHMEAMYQQKLDPAGKPLLDPATKAPILTKTIRTYYNSHLDSKTGFKYLAKPRVPPMLYDELEKRFPGGFFQLQPGQGIDIFLDFEEELFAKTGEQVKLLGFNLEEFKQKLRDQAKPAAAAAASPIPVTRK